jgi:hypothetical protein
VPAPISDFTAIIFIFSLTKTPINLTGQKNDKKKADATLLPHRSGRVCSGGG